MTDKDVGGKSQQVMAKVKDLEKPSHIKINVGGATDDIDKGYFSACYGDDSSNYHCLFNFSYYI